MTDLESRPNLSEYEQLLVDLEREIEIYKAQRTSLTTIVEALRKVEAASQETQAQASAAIAEGAQVFDGLKELDLPSEIANLQARYDQHQRSLTDVTATIQQLVQEQQRASLETLQNAQHTRESLELSAKDARAAAEAHGVKIASVGEQVSALSTQLSDHAGDFASTLRTHGESLADLQRQLNITRTVAVLTLVVLVLFAALMAFNVV